MVVVMASALPKRSTMLMWLVPYSGWSGMRAQALATPPGWPGLACGARAGVISRARSSQVAWRQQAVPAAGRGCDKVRVAQVLRRSAKARREASM